MQRKHSFPNLPAVLSVVVVAGLVLAASAQYPSGYPYKMPTAPKPSFSAPNMAGGLSTFGGNPYKSQFYPPTGTATGAKTGYRTLPSTVGNPLVHQPVKKPFSTRPAPRPLVNSMDAARISVASGLWDGGYLGY